MAIPRKTLTVTRPTAGIKTKGRFTDGAPSQFEITASVQPLNSAELASLPEGRRKLGAHKLYSSIELKVAEPGTQINPDVVTINGEDFEVFQVKPWNNLGSLDHYEIIVTRIQVQ